MNAVDFYRSKGWRVTSGFGSRIHPITRRRSTHHGIDFGGKSVGAPVHTPYAGTVRTARFFKDAGNAVAIKSAKTGKMLNFYHLHSLAVKPGQKVKAGDVIGANGSTGNSTGPHLHFEIRTDNNAHFGARPGINPAEYTEEVVKEVAKEAPREMSEMESALGLLLKENCLSSPDYWLTNAVNGKTIRGEYAAALIIRFANILREGVK